ncbi:MAG: SDR family oxidoreductase [Oricola sp.]|nr:short-chain dehydrogenase [Ahrensia sp.]MCK5746358.1 SDR family oxidoreductase [Oricola sp.]|tara:strand:- start:11204 stop:12061 length:858 start_codon:yes stop_codon:yes gene_type:complete
MTAKAVFGSSMDDLKQRPTVYASGLFAGKGVVITGAGGGLGFAIAVLFARLGANIAINGRNEEKLDVAAKYLRGFGGKVLSQSMSIRDPEQVTSFVEAAERELGGIDVLVNNAGGQFPQPAIEYSVKGWNAVIDTNLNGTWWMMQATARRWIEAKRPGSIISIVADVWRGMPGIAHSCAARAGVIYLSKSVAVEWAPHNIRVNCVAPGCCESNGFHNYTAEGAATFEESNPMRHAGDEWDVAEAVVYLAASSAKFITGEVLNVDGGQQLWGDPWPTGRPEYFRIA